MSNPKILIIEDCAVTRKALQLFLSDEYDIVETDQAEEGLRLIQRCFGADGVGLGVDQFGGEFAERGLNPRNDFAGSDLNA